MLDLLAVSYWNIGPFRDQKKTLFFKEGKYLIKAPIGSGKSFLFFDGPSYALYKSASRNLLNIQSKVGSIKLLFAYNEQVFLIKRILKKGKSKDSCASQLYELQLSPQELESKRSDSQILHEHIDLEDYLQERKVVMQEMQFKNESDLQAQLNSFLPPQEVFTSTVILLQDAENIFELQPAQRLEVLKNVFNLMSIEESKELVKERRNELKYQIKAYEDTSLTQEKLKSGLETLISLWKEIFASSHLRQEASVAQDALEELESLLDKLGISQFELDSAIGAIIEPMKSVISRYQEENQQKKSQLSAFLLQKQDLERQIASLQLELQKGQRRTEEIDRLLANNNPELITQLREEKKRYQDQQSELEKGAYTLQLRDFWNQYAERLDLEQKSDFGLLQNQLAVQRLIALGKNLKSESELLAGQVENIKLKAQTEQVNLENQLKTLQERIRFYDEQRSGLQEKIRAFETATEESARYSCEKIGENCPFIKAINKQYFEQRAAQHAQLVQEELQLQAKIQAENLTQKIENLKSELEKMKTGAMQAEQLQVISQKQKANEEKIQVLRTFFGQIDFKKLESLAEEYKVLSVKIADVEKLIIKQEELAQQVQSLQQEKAQLQGGMLGLTQQISQLETQKSGLQVQIEALQAELSNTQHQEREKLAFLVQKYETTYQNLQNLILDYKNLQLKIKSLAEQVKIMDNLYMILHKELLLFVLSEYLPILSEVINSYLVCVVDYQISIRLTETSEKLELETKILDKRGERDIKSLSGGQRAILKLVWMLAISSYMKTKLLFLDETINNLDNETVGRVADLLNDFVKQRAMKFYTITHNSEIQSMNIWDEVIQVAKEETR